MIYLSDMKKLKNKLEKKIAKYQKMLDVINGLNDDFVLPEKWCVLRDQENYKEINEWFIKNGFGKPWQNKHFIYIDEPKQGYDSYIEVPKGYTEITFEQFKKYVSLL